MEFDVRLSCLRQLNLTSNSNPTEANAGWMEFDVRLSSLEIQGRMWNLVLKVKFMIDCEIKGWMWSSGLNVKFRVEYEIWGRSNVRFRVECESFGRMWNSELNVKFMLQYCPECKIIVCRMWM